ncbi:hypothetical protein [Rhodoflexus caldus]|uniref:hypothetical protein n=1 Tax=Rhodoflexus caldus TaxID=2891236 RepID=UPI002029E89E|nr:hypothetical protein [Rhodoflexus caldus]
MKKMIKMMAAMAVFAMAVLVTPESTGASAPKKVRIGDCLPGTYDAAASFDVEVFVLEDLPATLHCDIKLKVTISPDCTSSAKVTKTDCYFI